MWTRAIALLSKMKNMWLKNICFTNAESILFEYWIQRLVTISILLSLYRALPQQQNELRESHTGADVTLSDIRLAVERL